MTGRVITGEKIEGADGALLNRLVNGPPELSSPEVDFAPHLRTYSFSLRASYNNPARGRVNFEGQFALGLDMDGVCLNDLDFHELTAQVLCHRYRVDVQIHEVREAREQGRDTWEFAMENVRGSKPQVSEEHLRRELREIEEYIHGHLQNRVLLCPEAARYLEQMPIKVFVATNRNEEKALAGIIELGVERLMPALFCQTDGHRTKPHADMLISARDKFDITERIIFVDDSAVNQRALAQNAAIAGIALDSVAPLAPGYGWSHHLESSLFDSGACVVVPSLNHLIKDLALEMFGDREAYQRIKDSMRAHHAQLDLRRYDPNFRRQFGSGLVVPVNLPDFDSAVGAEASA